jgi:hypothetical protein
MCLFRSIHDFRWFFLEKSVLHLQRWKDRKQILGRVFWYFADVNHWWLVLTLESNV